jgi:hypothetical protein
VPFTRFKLPPPPRWAFALVGLAAFAFLLRVYAGVWTPEHGITQFLRVGQEFDDRGLEVFRATPKFIDPFPAHRWGFDGQLYAQMGLDPLLRDPQLHVALDHPPYRAQRILLSWLAWIVGLGQPFWILNAYAAMNLIFWIPFAWISGRLFAPHGWAGLAGFAAVLLTCGVIESMQAALTDLPSFTLILAALVVGGSAGAGLLGLAALTRSTSLIGLVGLAEFRPPWRDAIRKNIGRGLIATVPVGLWFLYVLWVFRGREVGFDGGNLTMPFRGMMEKLGEFSVTAVQGPIRWHRWWHELYKNYHLHALLTIIAVVTQSIYIVLHRQWSNPLWRWGVVVVLYFSCISFLSWESHFTITRHALPITLVFNLLLALRPTRAWLIWFVLGNCFVPFGVRYFYQMRDYQPPPPPIEFVVTSSTLAKVDKPIIRVSYAANWSTQLWDGETTWRWASDQTATLALHNGSGQTKRIDLRFLARTRIPRALQIQHGDVTVARVELSQARTAVTLPTITLPPGETLLTFKVDGDLTESDDGTPGRFTLKVEAPQVILAAP